VEPGNNKIIEMPSEDNDKQSSFSTEILKTLDSNVDERVLGH
jgi:hypothetical protein